MTRHPDEVLAGLTAERARHLLAYDADTGKLTWRNPTARGVKVGDVAGTRAGKKGDYRYVSLDGNVFPAHRVVWLMVYGKWPDGDVAARNGLFTDLRISNLYVRTEQETALSTRKTTAKSGVRGVYQQPGGKWSAQIRRNYHMTHLGTFRTKEEAAAAVEAAKKQPLSPGNKEVMAKGASASRKYGLVHGLWVRTLRDNPVAPEWEQSFAAFCEAIGDGAFPQCRLVVIDKTKLLGPGNFRIEARAKYDRKTPEGRKAYYDMKNKASTAQRASHHRMYIFGVSAEQYAQMMADQKGVCAICKLPETATRNGRVISLGIDHCHTTGAIRELLCRDCNHVLGKFKDDPARFRAAADYIERHAAKSKSVPASNVIPMKKQERAPNG